MVLVPASLSQSLQSQWLPRDDQGPFPDDVAASARALAGAIADWFGLAMAAGIPCATAAARKGQLEAQLMDRNVTIELSDDAAKWLADKGYDDKMGARPLARVIQEHIKKPLAEELLFGKLSKGGNVRVLVRDDAIVLESTPPDRARIASKKPPLLTAE